MKNDHTERLYAEIEFKNPITVAIAGPPCTRCKFWNPKIVTDEHGEPAKVRLCQAEKMYFDFSCYEPRYSE